MEIEKTAYFEVCPDCGEHGKIVLPECDEESSFVSKTAGLDSLDVLRDDGYINPMEYMALKAQISLSELQDKACVEDVIIALIDVGILRGEYCPS